MFPLPEVLLLPGGMLPLNIFEPRYLAMVQAALGADRMIGMIQPLAAEGLAGDPPLYDTGCAGRISRFEETPDGRFLISLKGVCRFDIAEELAPRDGYRRVQADWSQYEGDQKQETPNLPGPQPAVPQPARLFQAARDRGRLGNAGRSAGRAAGDLPFDDLPLRRAGETGAAGGARPARAGGNPDNPD